MKKKDLFLKENRLGAYIEENIEKALDEKTNNWLQRCIWNSAFPKWCEKVEKHLEAAKDSENFIDRVLEDETLKKYQGYAELSKLCRPENHWYRVREMFGSRTFKTDSDAGAVKVGNQDFSVMIANGVGDGTSRVAVFNNKEESAFYSNMMNYQTTVCGEFYIYDYDCGNTPATKDGEIVTLKGTYHVYVYEGLVAFVQGC